MTNGERDRERDDEARKFNFQVERKTKESVKTKGGRLSVGESA